MKPDYKFSDFYKSVIESFSDNGKKVLDENLAVQNQFATDNDDIDVFSRAINAINRGTKDPDYLTQKSAIFAVLPYIEQAVSIFDASDVYVRGFFDSDSFKTIHEKYISLHRNMRHNIEKSMVLTDNSFSDFIVELRNVILQNLPKTLNFTLSNPFSKSDVDKIGFLKSVGNEGNKKIQEIIKLVNNVIANNIHDIYSRNDIDNVPLKSVLDESNNVNLEELKNQFKAKTIPNDIGINLLQIAYLQNIKQLIANIEKRYEMSIDKTKISDNNREVYFYTVGIEYCNNIDVVMHEFVRQMEYLKAFSKKDYDLFRDIFFGEEFGYSELYFQTIKYANEIKKYNNIGTNDEKIIKLLFSCQKFFFNIGELTDLISTKTTGVLTKPSDSGSSTESDDENGEENEEDEDSKYEKFKEKIEDARDEFHDRYGSWEQGSDDPLSPIRIRFEDELESYERMKTNLEKQFFHQPEGAHDTVSFEELIERDYRDLAKKLSGVRIILVK